MTTVRPWPAVLVVMAALALLACSRSEPAPTPEPESVQATAPALEATSVPEATPTLPPSRAAVSPTATPEPTPTATSVPAATPNMSRERIFHTATLLPDGTVLVAGGLNEDSRTVGQAESFSPASGLWTQGGRIPGQRFLHTATLLADGSVLVAGGIDAAQNIAGAARLYDPATQGWSDGMRMVQPRAQHSATLLKDGRVLFAGGVNVAFFPLAFAEVYDPDTQSWTSVAPMAAPRFQHTATLLEDGRVMLAGGVNITGHLASVEVYDANTDTWSLAGSMAQPRGFHSATHIGDGQVLIAGGTDGDGSIMSVELYDTLTDSWSPAEEMSTARKSHTATHLFDGRVLVVGGLGDIGQSLSSAELYDPTTATWSSAGEMEGSHAMHTATLLADGAVLVAGGADDKAVVASAVTYEPSTSAWTSTGAPRMPMTGEPQRRKAVQSPIQTSAAQLALRGTVVGLRSATGPHLGVVRFEVTNPSRGSDGLNMSSEGPDGVSVSYMYQDQPSGLAPWTATWLTGSGPILDPGERVQIDVDINGLSTPLGPYRQFAIELRPPRGLPLKLNRTTPRAIELVFDFDSPVQVASAPAPTTAPASQYSAPPPITTETGKQYTASILLQNGGVIVIELFAQGAPVTVNNFVFLSREGFYDGVTFHRVTPGFMAQAGDPTGTGTGGPGYTIENEFSATLRHDSPGVVAMANSGIRNGQATNGSQFYITYIATPFLDGLETDGSPKDCASLSCHTVFGRVIAGMDALKNIAPRDPLTANSTGDVIKSITIEESD